MIMDRIKRMDNCRNCYGCLRLREVKGVKGVLLDENTIEVLLREFISLLKQVDNLLKVIIINNATREISYSELLTITPGVQKIISELERLVKKENNKSE